MIYLYRLIAYAIYFATYPYGRIKALRGDALWRGRLAEVELPQADVWLHAASVGEVRIISYLIDYLQQADSSLRLHLTVMTRTGYETARAICPPAVKITFLPFDVPILWHRVIGQLRPQIVVVAETEIWPNLITSLKNARIPLVLVNGRLSEKSFDRYKALRASFSPLLASYEHFFVKGEDDLQRFLELGVVTGKMTLAGDMKFDAPLLERSEARRQKIRQSLGIGGDEFMFVGGSTRAGEEEQLLQLYCRLKGQLGRLRLVVVPRHVERAGEVRFIIEQAGMTVQVMGESSVSGERPVILVDRMGVLNDLYLAADLAFVGGTLVDIGGHNLLEPVWAGTPVLFGPSIGNVRDAAEYIMTHDFGAMVGSLDELSALVFDVASGKRRFATKTRADLAHSATASAGNYIMTRLHHA